MLSKEDPSLHLDFSVSSTLYAETNKMEIREAGARELHYHMVVEWRWR